VFKALRLIFAVLVTLSFSSCACSQKSYKHILPRHSFVKIEKELSIQTCSDEGCVENTFSAVASGVVVQNTMRGAYVLTAAHVCDESDVIQKHAHVPDTKIEFEFYVITLNSDKKPVQILDYDNTHDVCIVWVKNLFIQPVAIAPSGPEPGDVILNLAAPLGIFSDNMVPIFQGFYDGIDEKNRAVYSLPAYGGSSGSPIFNEKGELIGMVHSTIRHFNFITLSPTYNAMRKFIYKTIDQHMSYRFLRILWSPFMLFDKVP
jgi:S1-C subfamily serine protease